MIQKVLKIFKVNSINRLIIIFIVFAITGSLSVILGEYVLLLFFSDDVVKGFFYWVIRILIIFPLYQILLIIIGRVFGEFKYFWSIEKKILKRLKIIKSSSS
jgi:hypothetical protein